MVAVLDSVVLIGAFYRSDQWHRPAAAILRKVDEGALGECVLTDFILAETLNFMRARAGPEAGTSCLEGIESSESIRVERVTDGQFRAAKDVYFRRFPRLSFVDSLTVAFMKDRSVERLYSFDAGFDSVPGIRRLPSA